MMRNPCRRRPGPLITHVCSYITYVCKYIYIYTHTYTFVCIYIYGERERERRSGAAWTFELAFGHGIPSSTGEMAAPQHVRKSWLGWASSSLGPTRPQSSLLGGPDHPLDSSLNPYSTRSHDYPYLDPKRMSNNGLWAAFRGLGLLHTFGVQALSTSPVSLRNMDAMKGLQ